MSDDRKRQMTLAASVRRGVYSMSLMMRHRESGLKDVPAKAVQR